MTYATPWRPCDLEPTAFHQPCAFFKMRPYASKWFRLQPAYGRMQVAGCCNLHTSVVQHAAACCVLHSGVMPDALRQYAGFIRSYAASYARMQPAYERMKAAYARTTVFMQGRMQPACSLHASLVWTRHKSNQILHFHFIGFRRFCNAEMSFKVI